MNMDITTHTRGPKPEELVPSRYALQVGEIDVLVVSDGVLPLPTDDVGHQCRPSHPRGLA